MRHMVRVLVGTMLDRPDPEHFATLLAGRPARGGRPHRPAPRPHAEGRHLLTLKRLYLVPMVHGSARRWADLKQVDLVPTFQP